MAARPTEMTDSSEAVAAVYNDGRIHLPEFARALLPDGGLVHVTMSGDKVILTRFELDPETKAALAETDLSDPGLDDAADNDWVTSLSAHS